MKFKKFNSEIKTPTKSHIEDVGLDLYVPEDIELESLETKTIGLGLGFAIPEGQSSMLVPRSSSAKRGLLMQTQIIDPGYTGEIHLIITNCSKEKQVIQKGDRVCSLVVYNVLNINLEHVDELEKTNRGNKGLGSSGK